MLSNSYHLNQSDNRICIVEYDFCIGDQYVKVYDNSSVSICLQQYQEITNAYTRASNDQDDPEMYFSVICLSSSSAGCLLTIALTLVFQDPKQLPCLIKMALCFTLFLANTVYTISSLFESYPHICTVMGMLSHFLWVSVMCWMTISCLDIYLAVTSLLHLRRDKNVSKKVLLYFSINFAVSILMVALHNLLNFQQSQGSSLGYSATVCFLIQNKTKLYTFGLPLGLMVVVNSILFVYTQVRIRQNLYATEYRSATMLGVYFRLSAISGLSWVFGFVHQYTDIDIFSHAHTLLTGSQGMLILLAYVTTFKTTTRRKQSSGIEQLNERSTSLRA
jgi:cadherin EGF LAG seven-pass G-type receptor 1